jgi:hypothetical protein
MPTTKTLFDTLDGLVQALAKLSVAQMSSKALQQPALERQLEELHNEVRRLRQQLGNDGPFAMELADLRTQVQGINIRLPNQALQVAIISAACLIAFCGGMMVRWLQKRRMEASHRQDPAALVALRHEVHRLGEHIDRLLKAAAGPMPSVALAEPAEQYERTQLRATEQSTTGASSDVAPAPHVRAPLEPAPANRDLRWVETRRTPNSEVVVQDYNEALYRDGIMSFISEHGASWAAFSQGSGWPAYLRLVDQPPSADRLDGFLLIRALQDDEVQVFPGPNFYVNRAAITGSHSMVGVFCGIFEAQAGSDFRLRRPATGRLRGNEIEVHKIGLLDV